MTICRYYLQGTCRFGDRCRFEHVDPDSTEDSYNDYNRRHDYGYQDRYRPQGNQHGGGNKFNQDLSYGPRRYDNRDNQNQRYGSERYNQQENYGGNAKYNQSHKYDSYNRYNQRNDYDNYYTNRNVSSEKHHSNTPLSGFQKHQTAEYQSTKYDKSNYEWVSDDYKRRLKQQAEEKYNETPVHKSNIKSKVLFSFKDSNDESVNEKTLILAEIIKDDMIAWELGSQWPLSCYFPLPDKSGFPGFNDISPEELRYEAMKAKENNSYDSYIKDVEKTILDVNKKRSELKEPSKQLLCIIEKLRAGENLNNESMNDGGFSFMKSNECAVEDIITDDSSVNVRNAAASFSFKTAAPNQSSATSFSFKLPENEKFPSITNVTTTNSKSDIYTPLEQLSEEDREQFSASTFTLGKIPTVPPPEPMCF